jgi:hypothetical protein
MLQTLLVLLVLYASLQSVLSVIAPVIPRELRVKAQMAELSELISEPVALFKKRAASTPTEATTLIAYVSRKRLISQHLHFLDLQTPEPDQLLDVVLPCGHILQPGTLILPSDYRLALDDMHSVLIYS